MRISIEEYLSGVLNESPEEITETPETPTAENIFNVRDYRERELLDEAREQAFHHSVTQLLLTRHPNANEIGRASFALGW